LATPPLLLSVWGARRVSLGPGAQLGLLVAGLVVLRLCIPGALPVGSADAYRYLWDGLVQAQGYNPYAHAPQAEELAHLRDTWLYPQIFRADMRTVYPPLAQLSFRLAHAIGGGFIGLAWVYLLHDLVAAGLLAGLLRQRDLQPLRGLLFCWSPLLVVQSYAAAHLDVLLTPWLLLAFLVARRRPGLAGAALGCATMVRPIAALCGPALALRRPLREGLICAAGFAGAIIILVLPYASAGEGLFESLLIYAEHWRFNASLFRPLEALLGDTPWFRLGIYALIGALACGAGLLPVERPTRGMLGLGAYLALAPTVYPWYATGLLALLALRGGPLPLLLPALLTLSDLVLVDGRIGGPWEVPTAALWVEYIGIYGLALWQVVSFWRNRHASAAEGRRLI
jgi:alpha-1,6-mannosyltransferase